MKAYKRISSKFGLYISATIFVASFVFPGLAYCGQSGDEADPAAQAETRSAKANDLRGVYMVVDDQETSDAAVGRLTLQHIVEGTPQEVSRHHSFRSGDRFRFQVSANREGWLYVLHHTGDGPVQQLWPESSDAADQTNRLLPHETIQVPPSPAVFVFDQEVGSEHFYVAIVSEPVPPSLTAIDTPPSAESDYYSDTETPLEEEPLTETSSEEEPLYDEPSESTTSMEPSGPMETLSKVIKMAQRIVQFSVRSSSGQAPMRGVVLDPNPQDTDQATYFSLLPEDKGDSLVFEFQLVHEE